MALHNELGAVGEEMATMYLEREGYQILERNWKAPRSRHEIDIIAQGEGMLVIVEVKTRSSHNYGEPWEAVNWHKQKALASAAWTFVRMRHIDAPIRFDIIGIVGTEVTHIKQAFLPAPKYY